MRVFVINQNKEPLSPCHPAKARKLLSCGKAAVWKRYPFTIIMKQEVKNPVNREHRLKIDPGSKVTGLAILEGSRVLFGAELTHRGPAIKATLESRRAIRRGRRNRKTRYRKPRFNRKRPIGWLAPSLQHRVDTTLTWVNRLRKLAPISSISMELVRFDTQRLNNPEIAGIEYQKGELFGYEVREYLLTKWNRQCAYCGASGVPLQVEHIHPKSKGGSNRVSNLCLACQPCNIKKGTQPIKQFIASKPDILQRILEKAKRPLKDAAAVNSTRWALYHQLAATGLPVETGTGGMTKFNRTRLGLPKTHWLDAASVGQSTPENLITRNINPLVIKATGHGNRQMAQINKFGFPRQKKDGSHSVRTRTKEFHGFKTGDIVRAIVPTGKNQGTHVGRVTVRASRVFDLTTVKGKLQSINWKYFELIWKADGYTYVHKVQKCPLI
ncbi:RNA-guided endonuclease IscB [Coleofasciculus sp. F4-SAH-05]|jgi:5-methylcytosine-specific restriction endonuclease McrA|uniref:RNA-guided endonuclease IscB n=1 Tax=Coleofasciculus TaxID=669368 RepID=UPI0032F0A759